MRLLFPSVEPTLRFFLHLRAELSETARFYAGIPYRALCSLSSSSTSHLFKGCPKGYKLIELAPDKTAEKKKNAVKSKNDKERKYKSNSTKLSPRTVFEAEASGGGGVRQVVSPTLPYPLSLPSPFPFPLHPFLTSGREGQIQ